MQNPFENTLGFTLEKRTIIVHNVHKNMECAQLSIKEESEDETKYGSSGLHPDTGVLGEASTKVNVRQIRSISFQVLI